MQEPLRIIVEKLEPQDGDVLCLFHPPVTTEEQQAVVNLSARDLANYTGCPVMVLPESWALRVIRRPVLLGNESN